MAAYRSPGSVEREPPRVRPEAALVRPSGGFIATMIFASICALGALGTLPTMLGTSVECTRASEGATPECVVSEIGWLFVIDASSKTFAGKPEELRANDTTVTDDTPATELTVSSSNWHTRPIDPAGAKAAARDYEAFVADPKARSFDRRVYGGFGGTFLLVMMTAMALALFLFGRKQPTAWALVIDPEVDELLWETRYWRQQAVAQTFPLSKITKVDVESVDDSDSYEVFVEIDGVQRKICRASEDACKQAAPLIQRAIEANKSKEPDAEEASGSDAESA